MEYGLELTSKKFEEVKEIYLLEFINNGEKILIIGKDPENQKEKLDVNDNEDDILIDEDQKEKLDVDDILIDEDQKEKLKLIIWDLYNVEEVEPNVLDNS